MSTIRQRAAEGIQVGDVYTVTRTFTQADMEQFAHVSRDYNPVHFDARFARTHGFRAPVCHGLLVASMVTEVGGQMGWLASGMVFRFRQPVYIEDTVTCHLEVTEMDAQGRAKAQARFLNQHGEPVLEGEVTGFVPGSAQRDVLAVMMAEGDPTNPMR